MMEFCGSSDVNFNKSFQLFSPWLLPSEISLKALSYQFLQKQLKRAGSTPCPLVSMPFVFGVKLYSFSSWTHGLPVFCCEIAQMLLETVTVALFLCFKCQHFCVISW
ncbi:hypothetical protein ILYODFUR_033224 [Ilyodon furcidens]|uniref:Uncharacterized protein n=1 Tax=Ilyodon furcidens TaxID=33524 RepID=A0ABV0TD40_9TELE